ncbi:MAG: primosomal protein N' [Lentisphaeria bacterium]|jgi:primosomal protein N' (replication factor Y)|nr:primosomal protein N' [Lentisphaeria bacterium]
MAVARIVLDLMLDREFDYLVPPELAARLRPGMRVMVPFGKGASRAGCVIGIKDSSEFPNLKAVESVVGDREQIPPSLLRLSQWISEYYCCPIEAAVRAMLPAAVRGGKIKHREEKFACLAEKATHKGPELAELTAKQRHTLETLTRLGSVPVSELREVAEVGPTVIGKLEEKGWIVIEQRQVGRDPFEDDIILPTRPLSLTRHQGEALAMVINGVDSADGCTILLHGVTGSGKTEVYLQAIDHCLKKGREAIVLVPEISLTPQTCERFRARFGEEVSVLHSGLSDGERFDEWTKINEGRTRIVVGARSALFAPFRHLGLIVVDEEHESSYKQDEAPRYNARDVAVVRGRMEQATVVLGSATPALESYHNCQQGKYLLAELPERVDDQRMPIMEVVDMAAEASLRGGAQIFSRRLEDLVNERLENGEQTIFFLNRRGYATQFLCSKCGYVANCDECSVTFTYHRRDQMLACHLCGHLRPAPEVCPQCGNPEVRYTGIGTERIESAAHAVFPRATIARMDSDTMTTRRAYQKTLAEFGAGRIHILIGTQMIAKGLHFPNVTLVGVIFADLGLHLPDFRAGERTFQLLTQVAGRAGRGDRAGRVIVQTYTPFHPALQFALEHDFKGFYREEMEARNVLAFPPATHMILVHFRGKELEKVAAAAAEFAARLQPLLPPEVQLMGPMPAPIARIRGLFRFHLTLRGGPIAQVVRILRPLVLGQRTKEVDIQADVDPRSLM